MQLMWRTAGLHRLRLSGALAILDRMYQKYPKNGGFSWDLSNNHGEFMGLLQVLEVFDGVLSHGGSPKSSKAFSFFEAVLGIPQTKKLPYEFTDTQ